METFLTKARTGRAIAVYREKQVVFVQGDDPADAVFYIERGQIKLTVVSEQGKSAVLAILGHGDFFGEGCLAGQSIRVTAASAMTEVVRIEKQAMIGLLHKRSIFSAGAEDAGVETAPVRPQAERHAGDEYPSLHHSITWSARCRSEGGIVRPRALAVLRLMTSSNLVGNCTGSSPGFAPRRMRST
jgi:hypothetical protein